MTTTTNTHLLQLMGLFNAVCPAYFGAIEINEGQDTMISQDTMFYIVRIIGDKRYNMYKSTDDNKISAHIEGISYALSIANQEIKRIAQG